MGIAMLVELSLAILYTMFQCGQCQTKCEYYKIFKENDGCLYLFMFRYSILFWVAVTETSLLVSFSPDALLDQLSNEYTPNCKSRTVM